MQSARRARGVAGGESPVAELAVLRCFEHQRIAALRGRRVCHGQLHDERPRSRRALGEREALLEALRRVDVPLDQPLATVLDAVLAGVQGVAGIHRRERFPASDSGQ